MSTALPHIKAGKLRVLGVGTATRVSALPEAPIMNESLPGFLSTVWFGLAAPPKTPPAISAKLSAPVADVLKQPDVIAKLDAITYRTMGGTPADMSRFVRQEQERWDKVIRAAKITAN